MVLHITKENFDVEVLQSDKTVLVDFWATWCTPCQMLGPVLEEFASEREDIKVCKVDVDESVELMQQFGIMTVPTLIAFKDGKEVSKSIGVVDKSKMAELVK